MNAVFRQIFNVGTAFEFDNRYDDSKQMAYSTKLFNKTTGFSNIKKFLLSEVISRICFEFGAFIFLAFRRGLALVF